MRLLWLIAVVSLVVWAIRRLRRELKSPPRAPQSRTGPKLPQAMVRCAHCGVHLPLSDAVADGDLQFCGEAHRRLGARAS